MNREQRRASKRERQKRVLYIKRNMMIPCPECAGKGCPHCRGHGYVDPPRSYDLSK